MRLFAFDGILKKKEQKTNWTKKQKAQDESKLNFWGLPLWNDFDIVCLDYCPSR